MGFLVSSNGYLGVAPSTVTVIVRECWVLVCFCICYLGYLSGALMSSGFSLRSPECDLSHIVLLL